MMSEGCNFPIREDTPYFVIESDGTDGYYNAISSVWIFSFKVKQNKC